MKDLVEFIACSLVNDPTQVRINQMGQGQSIHFELTVAKEDMGRIIGKHGKVANSMRTLLKVAAARTGKRVSLDIIDPK